MAHLLRQQQRDAERVQVAQAEALNQERRRFAQLVEDRHTYLKRHPLISPITPNPLQLVAFEVRHQHPGPFLDYLIGRRDVNPARFDRVFPVLGPLLGAESGLFLARAQGMPAVSAQQLAASPPLMTRLVRVASATSPAGSIQAETLLPPDTAAVAEPSGVAIGLVMLASVALARRVAGWRRASPLSPAPSFQGGRASG
jgi:hypothetical protein